MPIISRPMLVSTLAAATLAFGLQACRQQESPAGPDTAAPSTVSLQEWLGRWNGPEGTYLDLALRDGAYKVTIANLDGPRDYAGRAVADHIEFERDGVSESIHATDGQATGMKWLLDKHDCLTVKAGEGYCRD